MFSDYRQYIKKNIIANEVERMTQNPDYKQPLSEAPQMLPYHKVEKFSSDYGLDFIDKFKTDAEKK